jgi:hypothetical protein
MRIWWKYAGKKNWALCSITMQQRKRKKEDEDYNVIIFGLVWKRELQLFCRSTSVNYCPAQGISMWMVANLLVPWSKTKIQKYQSPWWVSQAGRLNSCKVGKFVNKTSNRKNPIWKSLMTACSFQCFMQSNHPIYPWTLSTRWTTKSIVQES